jgi:5-methylcytosine-specific restriction protein A
MRARVLHEEPLCRYCRACLSTQVDHIIPLAQGGTSERDNLAGVCRGCHNAKTHTEAQRAKVAAGRTS